MKLAVVKNIPVHLISGFLGAGKTTLLKSLLSQKPEGEVWAVLMNEFGQIGVDQLLIADQEDYYIQELLGGCLCCSSQLPMQLALSRLLHEQQPDRLFIETTGLGHPAQIIEQLMEPHWHAYLSMKSPITVLDGSQLTQAQWRQHPLYMDQLKAAKIVVISHVDLMQPEDWQALTQLKHDDQLYAKTWLTTAEPISIAEINQQYMASKRKIQALLKVQKAHAHGQADIEIKQMPYHYVETAQGYSVAGWKFPQRWIFNFNEVFDLLCEQQQYLRIKAIFHTDQGWKAFNFNAEQFNYQDISANIDNRIEIIYQGECDWVVFEAQLLSAQSQL